MKHRRSMLTLTIFGFCLAGVSVFSLSRATENAQITNPSGAVSNTRVNHTPAVEPIGPHSRLTSPLDLEVLTREADLIVIGSVDAIEDNGPTVKDVAGERVEAERMVVTLNINGLIKGKRDDAVLSFEFLVPSTLLDYVEIKVSQFGMFFLRKTAQGGYAVLNSDYPFIIAPAKVIVADGNDLDKVVGVIGLFLTEPKSSVYERRDAVHILSSARTELATRILRQATQDSDETVRLQALCALLGRNDISMLDVAEDTLLHPAANTEEYLLTNLSAALMGIKDIGAIPTLERLLSSSNSRTRLRAIMTLRQMHSSKGIVSLVAALDDKDQDVRYEAVMGLAELTGQTFGRPAISVFQADEQHYLEHWKAWAQTR
jgi:hypothetical protein